MDSLLNDYEDSMRNLIAIFIIKKLYDYVQAHYRTEVEFQAWIRRHNPRACLDQYRMPIEIILDRNKLFKSKF